MSFDTRSNRDRELEDEIELDLPAGGAALFDFESDDGSRDLD